MMAADAVTQAEKQFMANEWSCREFQRERERWCGGAVLRTSRKIPTSVRAER